MIPVIIESPYAGNVERNTKYLKECVLDCLKRGESPYASHAFFTQFLDDKIPEERTLGIEAGFVWSQKADKVVFYGDLGISPGMRSAALVHSKANRVIELRHLYLWEHRPASNSMNDRQIVQLLLKAHEEQWANPYATVAAQLRTTEEYIIDAFFRGVERRVGRK